MKKIIKNGYISALTDGEIGIEISESECAEIIMKLKSVPKNDNPNLSYRLRADTLEWELVELPPMPEDDELTAEEALDIITGGAE